MVVPLSVVEYVDWLARVCRWQQSPDGLKGHDPQFWAPLSFDASGNVLPLHWVDNFTMVVNVSASSFAVPGL